MDRHYRKSMLAVVFFFFFDRLNSHLSSIDVDSPIPRILLNHLNILLEFHLSCYAHVRLKQRSRILQVEL